MNTILSVVEARRVSTALCLIEIDEYLPLRFRTYAQPIGAAYLRLGNYTTTLTELIIEPNLRIVRGLTITAYDCLSPWPDFAAHMLGEGMPVLDVNFTTTNYVDLCEAFSVSIFDGKLLVFWQKLGNCSAYTFGSNVQFLLSNGCFCGVCFTGLSQEQEKIFAAHSAAGIIDARSAP